MFFETLLIMAHQIILHQKAIASPTEIGCNVMQIIGATIIAVILVVLAFQVAPTCIH
jgi:hypothetical protein